MTEPVRHTCRQCGGELEPGYVQIHGTLLGFLFFGFSYTNLFFRPDGKKSEEKPVLGWRRKHIAYRCLRCGGMVITPHYDPSDNPRHTLEV